jgi:hypothetical protein
MDHFKIRESFMATTGVPPSIFHRFAIDNMFWFGTGAIIDI